MLVGSYLELQQQKVLLSAHPKSCLLDLGNGKSKATQNLQAQAQAFSLQSTRRAHKATKSNKSNITSPEYLLGTT
jgi:hypothetical protein